MARVILSTLNLVNIRFLMDFTESMAFDTIGAISLTDNP